MMKKRTIMIGLVLCVVLAFGLAGCGSEGAVKEPYDYDMSEYVTLGDYKGVEIEVSDKIVSGDVVNIDFAGRVDGELFEGGSTEPDDGGFNLTIGSGQLIPGFEQGLIGAAVGDTVVLDLNFPDPYTTNQELSGKPVEFTVTVNSIDKEQAKENAVWDAIMADSEILAYPEKELQERKQTQYDMYETYASNLGIEMEEFLSQSGMTQEDYDAYVEQYAKLIVDMEMVLYAIAETEDIAISDKEYKDGIKRLIQNQGYKDDKAFKDAAGVNFEEYAGKENIMTTLLLEKVMDYVVAEAVEVETQQES